MSLRTLLIAALALAGCHKKTAETGSGSGSGSGSSVAPPDATPKVTIDAAPPPATFDMFIRNDGVGPITSGTDPKTLESIFPGTKVDDKHWEGEATLTDTYTVSNNGTNLVEALLDHNADETKFLYVTVVSSAFVTKEGVRIGTTVADFIAKGGGDCKRVSYHTGDNENLPEYTHTFECTASAYPNVKFMLDETKPSNQGEDGKVIAAKIQAEKIVRIVWFNPDAKLKSPLSQ
ncbi:MAG: hypothetical protein QM831_06390 [Kofleriaceae bacterium]